MRKAFWHLSNVLAFKVHFSRTKAEWETSQKSAKNAFMGKFLFAQWTKKICKVSVYPIIRLGDASYRMSEISWLSFMSLEYWSWVIRAKKWVRWSELWNTGVGLECRKWVGWVKCGLGDESLRMPENELGQLDCDCNFVPFHNWAENELGELGYMWALEYWSWVMRA